MRIAGKRKPIGIAIEPAHIADLPQGGSQVVRDLTIYVVCDDGSVFAHVPSRREEWLEQTPIPGTEAAGSSQA